MKEKEVLKQIDDAIKSVKELNKSKDLLQKYQKQYNKIVFSSIGKSKLISNVLIDIDQNLNIKTSRSNKLENINQRSLVIIVSYTGKTRDIIEFYKYVQKKTKNIIIITSNISLINDGITKKYLTIKVPKGYSSTNSFYLMLYSTIFALKKLKLTSITNVQIKESIKKIENFSKNYKAIEFSNKLNNKIPLIYTWNSYPSLSALISRSFNIKAKSFCMINTLPEAGYNEIEVLANSKFSKTNFNKSTKTIVPIFIYPKEKNKRIKMDLIKTYSKESLSIEVPKGCLLTKIIYLNMFFELVSEKLAKKYHLDMNSDKYIESFKKIENSKKNLLNKFK